MTLCPSTSRSPRIAEGGVIVQDIGDGSCYAHVGLLLVGLRRSLARSEAEPR